MELDLTIDVSQAVRLTIQAKQLRLLQHSYGDIGLVGFLRQVSELPLLSDRHRHRVGLKA